MNEFEYEHRLTSMEERMKSNENRITDLEKRQNDLDELVTTVKALAIKEENVETTVKEIKNDVKALTSKPAQRWENMVNKIIMLIIAAIVGYIMAKLGFS